MLEPAQACDLVEHFGGCKPAARAVGIPASTLRYWLNPEPNRQRARRNYHADVEASRARRRDDYYAESALQRSWRQLRIRRTKALHRRAQRSGGGNSIGALQGKEP